MRVGVVMPTHNQAQWLPGALASVWRQETHHPRLRVVVDDGSTDATPKILREFAKENTVGLLSHEANRGTAAAINTGVDHLASQVDVLGWVSSDNVMERDWLYWLESEMERGAGAAYGGFYIVTPDRVTYAFQKHERDKLLNDVNCYYGPAFLIRKDVWLEAGPHRGKISHDYDHWLRVEEVCYRRGLPIVGVDQPLCWYQAHEKRAGVVKAHEFDAHHWQAEARKRRGVS